MHTVRVRWGMQSSQEAIYENDQDCNEYEFSTKAEKDAFILGVEEADGWVESSFLEVQEDENQAPNNADAVLADIRDMLFLDDAGGYDMDREQDPELWDDITNKVREYFSI